MDTNANVSSSNEDTKEDDTTEVQSNADAESDTKAEYTIDDVHSAIDDLRTLIVAQTELISSMICDGPARVDDVNDKEETEEEEGKDDTILEDLDYSL